MRLLRHLIAAAVLTLLVAAFSACSESDTPLIVYSGRSESLIQPVIDQFSADTGIDVQVKYADSADLALLIQQEGNRSRADVFISQSPGAVGFLAGEQLLARLPDELLSTVDSRFRNENGQWIGISGRVRVLVYNSELVNEADLPESVLDLTGDDFKGRVALAPSNGSFQDFVTAFRQIAGDDQALAWLEGMASNEARGYAKNSAIVQAVAAGEIEVGLVNHYYNFRYLEEDPGAPSLNHIFPDGDLGGLMIITAGAVIESSDQMSEAGRFLEYLLSVPAQTYFAEQTFEYPLAPGVEPAIDLPPLSDLPILVYDFDELGGGLERTKELIDQSGLSQP